MLRKKPLGSFHECVGFDHFIWDDILIGWIVGCLSFIYLCNIFYSGLWIIYFMYISYIFIEWIVSCSTYIFIYVYDAFQFRWTILHSSLYMMLLLLGRLWIIYLYVICTYSDHLTYCSLSLGPYLVILIIHDDFI